MKRKSPFKTLVETPIFSLESAQVHFQGNEAEFYRIHTNDWVNIIALTAQQEVILVRQTRFGVEEDSLEIPGGVMDQGELPLVAAQRELAEETGYTSSKWTSLGFVTANPAIMNNRCHLFLAEECRCTEALNLDAFEDIRLEVIPVAEFLEKVKSNEIHHALVVAAVAQWMLKK